MADFDPFQWIGMAASATEGAGGQSGAPGDLLNAPINQRSGPAYSGAGGQVVNFGSNGVPWGWIVAGVLAGLLFAAMRKGKR